MISYFTKGKKAAELGFGTSLCMLEGQAREEWMLGYKAFKPTKTEFFDIDTIRDEFESKHFFNSSIFL